MATINETYKIALENRNALNDIKDKAKETDEFPLVTAIDTDLIRVTRGGASKHTPVSDIRSLSGAGEDNVQANWDEIDGNVDAYIKNKPENLSDFNDDLVKNVIPESVMEIMKAPGNLLTTLESGDAVRGFWNSVEYWRFAIYNSGDTSLKASYIIYDYFEI